MLMELIQTVLQIYSFIIIAAALITWVQPNPYNPVVRFLRRATEPVLRPIRSVVPPEKLGGLDISPMIALFIIWYVIPRILWALLV
jgi:YggT family protein